MKHVLFAATAALLLFSGTLQAAPAKTGKTVRIDFRNAQKDGKAVTGWTYKGKFATDDAEFSIRTVDGVKVLRMVSQKATGSLL